MHTNLIEVLNKIRFLKGFNRQNEVYIKENSFTITNLNEVANIIGQYFWNNSRVNILGSKFTQNTENIEKYQTTISTIDPNNPKQFLYILETE